MKMTEFTNETREKASEIEARANQLWICLSMHLKMMIKLANGIYQNLIHRKDVRGNHLLTFSEPYCPRSNRQPKQYFKSECFCQPNVNMPIVYCLVVGTLASSLWKQNFFPQFVQRREQLLCFGLHRSRMPLNDYIQHGILLFKQIGSNKLSAWDSTSVNNF